MLLNSLVLIAHLYCFYKALSFFLRWQKHSKPYILTSSVILFHCLFGTEHLASSITTYNSFVSEYPTNLPWSEESETTKEKQYFQKKKERKSPLTGWKNLEHDAIIHIAQKYPLENVFWLSLAKNIGKLQDMEKHRYGWLGNHISVY